MRRPGMFSMALSVLAALSLVAMGCSTEFHYHEGDASGAGGDHSHDDEGDASGDGPAETGDEAGDETGGETGDETGDQTGDEPVDDGLLHCPDGYQPSSTGEFCAPICADGYTPNEAETGCVPLEPPTGGGGDAGRTECPDGFIPSGAGGGADELCLPVLPISVHGIVSDAATGLPVAGASVVLYPLVDAPMTADDAGYFKMEDVPFAGVAQLSYGAAGYLPGQQAVELPLAGGDGQTVLLVDASVALTPVPKSVDPPIGEHTVAGTIYAGSGPASGAVVRLYNATVGVDVAAASAAVDGTFVFTDIYDDGYDFSLRMDAWDADGDGVTDFQYQELALGGLDHVDAALGLNLTNLVIVLAAVAKEIAWANFTPPVTGVSGPATLETLNLSDPAANIVLQLGAEAAPATLVVSLRERFGSAFGDEIDLVVTWNASGTKLTLDPASTLEVDADPTTRYELRVDALLWADGTALVPLGGGPGNGIKIVFDVGAAPSLLPSPTPQTYLAGHADEDQVVTQMQCDSRVCWLVDSDGHPFHGLADPADPAAADAFFNGASGLALTWTAVAGAAGYRVYARQAFSGPTAAVGPGWHEVAAELGASIAGSGVTPMLVATGVMASGSPGWHAFGIGAAGGAVGNPLALSNGIELAVTTLDGQGHESAIDDAKLLGLVDTTQVGVIGAAEAPPEADEVELGMLDVGKSIDLRLTELCDTSESGHWSVHSGHILALTQPADIDWEVEGAVSIQGASDKGRFGPMRLDFRGTCTEVVAAAGPSDHAVAVHDTGLLSGGGEVIFLTHDGTSLAHSVVRSVSAVDHAAKVVSFVAELGESLEAGEHICIAHELEGFSTEMQDTGSAGESTLTVTDPLLFYPNQPIIIFSQNPDPVMMAATVLRVREPVLSPQGFVVLPGEMDITPALAFSRDEAVIMARPSAVEQGFRPATELALAYSVTTDESETLPLAPGPADASTILRGDLLLIDVDGALDTVSDQHYVEIDVVHMEPAFDSNPPDYRVTMTAAPGFPGTLPEGLFLQASTTRILHLGDSFFLAAFEDTSNNSGVHDGRDQFSFCAPSFEPCQGGIFVH